VPNPDNDTYQTYAELSGEEAIWKHLLVKINKRRAPEHRIVALPAHVVATLWSEWDSLTSGLQGGLRDDDRQVLTEWYALYEQETRHAR
jgi:hypothetical protein